MPDVEGRVSFVNLNVLDDAVGNANSHLGNPMDDVVMVDDNVADHFSVVPSTTAPVVGEPFTVTVRAQDSDGETDTHFAGEITLDVQSGNATFYGEKHVLTNGMGIFSVVAVDTSPFTVKASYDYGSEVVAVGISTPITATPLMLDAPDRLGARDYRGADGMGDQGGFVLLSFDLSEHHQILTGYRIYREIALSLGREKFIPWAKVDPVPGVDSVHVVVPALDNVPTRWGVAAEMGAATSGMMPSPKRVGTGDVVFATLDLAATERIFGTRSGIRAKVVSSGTSTSPMTITADKVRAVDNVPPAPVVSMQVLDTPFDDGGSITVSWEKSSDDRILSAYEVNGGTVPLLGVHRYVVYRQEEGGAFVRVGDAGSGAMTFIDRTVDDVVSYTYTVRAADLDNEMEGPVASGWSQALGDVSRNGSVHAYDASLILREVVGDITLPDPAWPGFTVDIADVSGNRGIAAFDAALVLRRVVGLIDRYPVQAGVPAMLAGMFPEVRTVRLSDVPMDGEGVFVIPVSLDEQNRVFSGYVEIAFDPALFEAEEVIPSESSAYVMVGAMEENRVRIAFATSEPSSGPGAVAEVRFRVLELDEDAMGMLTLEEVQLNEGMTAVRTVSGTYGMPTVYALLQNYPNPFNPETTIRYALPMDAWVSLTVYSAAGQRIRVLVEEKQGAGYHRAVWDGTDNTGCAVASGVYLCRMIAGDYRAVRKLVLVR